MFSLTYCYHVILYSFRIFFGMSQSNVWGAFTCLGWYILHIWHHHKHFLFVTSPSGQLDAYIKNLERVLDAIDFFNQNNPNCLELSNLVSVLFWIIIGYNTVYEYFLTQKKLAPGRFRLHFQSDGSWFKASCILFFGGEGEELQRVKYWQNAERHL